MQERKRELTFATAHFARSHYRNSDLAHISDLRALNCHFRVTLRFKNIRCAPPPRVSNLPRDRTHLPAAHCCLRRYNYYRNSADSARAPVGNSRLFSQFFVSLLFHFHSRLDLSKVTYTHSPVHAASVLKRACTLYRHANVSISYACA